MNGNIIILGSPGSGKGTLAKLLKDKYNYINITTGDILRKQTGEIKELIDKGNLVPDNIMNQIVKEEINNKSKFILDGFPRTVKQGEFLESITEIDLVIYLEVSEETIKKRILERGKISNRKDDQDLSIINHRIEKFKKETFPLVEFYKKKDLISYINGEETIEQVFKQVENLSIYN